MNIKRPPPGMKDTTRRHLMTMIFDIGIHYKQAIEFLEWLLKNDLHEG